MGMRFDRVKTSDWVNLGNQVGGAYVKGQAANAHAEGSAQSTNTESNYGRVDPNAVYTGEGADGGMTNAEAASYGLSRPVEDAEAGTGTKRRYALGSNPTQWQDTEFTPEQRRVGGLRAQMAYYDGRGQTDEADRIRTQIDAGETQQREKTRFAQEQEQRARIEGAWGNTPAAPAPGVALPRANAPVPGVTAPAAAGGALAGVAATGLKRPGAPAPLSAREQEQRLLNVAEASRDVRGVRESRAALTKIDFDEGYAKHRKGWDEMGDEVKSALIQKLSYDTGVKGYGTWTAGKGKSAGYMTFLPPTGDPVRLSNKEAGELYALTNLMEIDPSRARAEMDKVSDKVATLASHAFDSVTKGVVANNTAVRYGNADANDAARLGIERQKADREKVGQVVNLTGKNGEAIAGVTVLGKNGKVSVVPMELPAGAKWPKQVDPAAIERRAAALVGQPMPTLLNGKKQVYDADTAYAAAQRQLYGDVGTSASEGGRAPAVAPPERGAKAAPAAPQGGLRVPTHQEGGFVPDGGGLDFSELWRSVDRSGQYNNSGR